MPTDRPLRSDPIQPVLAIVMIGHVCQAREAAMLSTEMVRQALDSAPDAIMIVDKAGSIVFLNRQVSALFGYKASELEGQGVEILVPERFRAQHAAHRQEFAAHLRLRQMGGGLDLLAVRKDGTEFPAEVSLSPIADRTGLLVVVAIRDVSERKQAEVQLRESEERFRELGNHSRDVIWIVGLNPVRVLYVSPTLESIWGLATADLYRDPRAWEPRVHPDDKRRVYQAWEEACNPATTRGFEAEYRIIRPNGSICWLSDLLTAVRNAAGDVVRVCGVSRDITEQKRLEQALLEATDRERRSLGHDLHDGLGQELTAISLLAGAIGSSARKTGRPDADGLAQLEGLTRRAIDTCRSIARGLSPLGYANGDLVDALREMVRVQHDSFGLDIRFAPTTAAPLRLTPDAADHLFRIAQEAVTNARRHAKAQVITVTLDIQRTSVRLEVLDDGVGLAIPTAHSDGIGLKIMQFRASVIGGRLSIGPGEHGGTLVTCECAQPAEQPVVTAASQPASSR
jgi:PAS domain S-box-containing protein